MQTTADIESARYVPSGATPIRDKATDAVAYVYEANGVPHAIGYCGRRKKHDFHFRFRSVDRRSEHIADFFRSRAASIAATARRRAESKPARTLEVGSILCASWGYEQTNVDFYQVTRLVGKQSVALRPIAAQHVRDTGWCQGVCKPAKDKFTGDEFTRRVGRGQSVRITSYSYARPCGEDEEKRWSSYA